MSPHSTPRLSQALVPPFAWLIDDLKKIVLDLVYDEGRGRASLLSVALSSKASTHVSLERLWKEIPHLPLLDKSFRTEAGREWLQRILDGEEVRPVLILH